MSIEPRLQTYWDWRAANNWIGGGTGSGLMIAAAVFTLAGVDSYMIALVSMVFVAVGLFSVLMKIGRPLRALYVYRNPFTSWMSREAWVAFLVFPFGAAAFWYQSEILLVLAALSAYGYMFCQAMILKASRAIRAWRVQEIVAYIIASSILEGAALAMIIGILFTSLALHPALPSILVMLLLVILFRGYTWRRYFNVLKDDAPEGTVAALSKVNTPFMLAGDLLPALLLLVALISDQFITTLGVIAGIILVASGWYIKYVIVVKAGFYEGFAMAHTPARGAGKPGPGVKPGWVKNK
jgi:phenylacetyl-CoA:acceptor oxidoreductase subunit 2